jgi:hypothetical protein
MASAAVLRRPSTGAARRVRRVQRILIKDIDRRCAPPRGARQPPPRGGRCPRGGATGSDTTGVKRTGGIRRGGGGTNVSVWMSGRRSLVAWLLETGCARSLAGLGLAPSTISREVARNGGRRRYRALAADRAGRTAPRGCSTRGHESLTWVERPEIEPGTRGLKARPASRGHARRRAASLAVIYLGEAPELFCGTSSHHDRHHGSGEALWRRVSKVGTPFDPELWRRPWTQRRRLCSPVRRRSDRRSSRPPTVPEPA